MLLDSHTFSCWASKVTVSIVLAILGTGFAVSPILFIAKPNTTNSMSHSPTQQLTFGNWNDIQPIYSSYGLIAYSSDKTGTYQIYTMDQNGNHQTQLTPIKGNASYPEFSPDGRIISYLWSHDPYTDLCFVSVTFQYASSSSFCATNDAHVGIHYSWSQDAKIIAYDNGTQINLYSIGENRTTIFPYKGTAYDPEFCGANLLCFTGSTNHMNQTAIWISNLDGRNPKRLSWTGSDSMPQFSPVTNMVLYLANYTGIPEAWVVGTNDTLNNVLFQIVASADYTPPDLPKISAGSPPKWNPTNDEVLVTGTMDNNMIHFVIANITLVPALRNSISYLVTPFSVMKSVAASAAQCSWSPDGRSIIYVSRSTSGFQKIFLINLKSAPLSSVYGS